MHIEQYVDAVRRKPINSVFQNGDVRLVELALLDRLSPGPHCTQPHCIEAPLPIQLQTSHIQYLVVVVRISFHDGVEAVKDSDPTVLVDDPAVYDGEAYF